MKWISASIWVDIETGEIIPKKDQKKYKKLKINKHYNHEQKTVNYITEAKRIGSEQLGLFKNRREH